MLTFQVEAGEEASDQGKFNEKAFEALQEHHLSCLREMQDLSLEYPESADWLKVDTCAGEDILAQIKEKAKEIPTMRRVRSVRGSHQSGGGKIPK